MENQYHISFILDDGGWGSLYYVSPAHGMELINDIRSYIQDQTHEYNFVIVAISKV